MIIYLNLYITELQLAFGEGRIKYRTGEYRHGGQNQEEEEAPAVPDAQGQSDKHQPTEDDLPTSCGLYVLRQPEENRPHTAQRLL